MNWKITISALSMTPLGNYLEAATVWTSLRERASDKGKNVISEGNKLSGADMREILANTQGRVAMTMASCSKACKYAVGFGNDKVQRIKAALLALAAAMTCDLSNCEKVRLRHLEFAILCKRICIDIDSDGIISDLQQTVLKESTRILGGEKKHSRPGRWYRPSTCKHHHISPRRLQVRLH